MEDIGLIALISTACFIKWPVKTTTMVLSLPISVGITLNEKLREKIKAIRNHKLTFKNKNLKI